MGGTVHDGVMRALRSWGHSSGAISAWDSEGLRFGFVGRYWLYSTTGQSPWIRFGPRSDWFVGPPAHAAIEPCRVRVTSTHGLTTELTRLVLPPEVGANAIHVPLDNGCALQEAVRRIVLFPEAPFIGTRVRDELPLAPAVKALQRAKQVVLWASASTHSRLMLWQVSQVLQSRDTEVWVVPCSDPRQGDRRLRLALRNEDWFAFAVRARAVAGPTLARLAANWIAWRGGKRPKNVSLRGFGQDAWVGTVPATFWELFPRVHRGRYQLSPFDRRALSLLGRRSWRDVIDLVASEKQGTELMMEYGDKTIFDRIGDWATLGDGRYVESRSNPDPQAHRGRGLLGTQYRLTSEGARLLRDGLSKLSDAPPMQSGGFRFYEDPKAVQ